MRYTAYGFLSCCSCCDAGESGGKMCAKYFSGVFTPIIRRSDCVILPMVFCPVVAVVMLESRGAGCVQSSTQCTHLAIRLCNITIVTTEQKTIGSVTQSDLLMMGVKTSETC